MRILVERDRYSRPEASSSTVVLRADRWNDYGYITLYRAELYRPETGEWSDVGDVKIMKSDMSSGGSRATNLKPGKLDLDDSYCSLGQATSYYENLSANLTPQDFTSYLKQTCDVVSDPDRYSRFKDHDAFITSLLREGSAQRALNDARELLLGKNMSSQVEFNFVTNVGGSQFSTHFTFADSEELPSRINAIIGYNGVGKDAPHGKSFSRRVARQ